MISRSSKLYRNFGLMFWINALTSVQVMNVIMTIFMVHRGLTLSQILYLSIIFSVTTLFSEVPSSYLADRWGRKRVIILSNIAALIYWIITIFANSFFLFALSIIFWSISNAFLSGTDEALIYDTSHELDIKEQGLKRLGNYFSGQRIFKIFIPLVAVLIARDLSETQFVFMLLIDVIAVLIAIFISFFIEEPKHFFKVEKVEAGVMLDSIKIFRQNPQFVSIILNKTLLFIATFILWRISSDFFVVNGATILAIGIATVIYHLLVFIFNLKIDKFLPQFSVSTRIHWLNLICTFSLVFFFLNSISLKNIIIYLSLYTLIVASESIRWPLFSQFFNSNCYSYNRATVLSLTNILKSFMDIPLLFLSAILVKLNFQYLFGLIALVGLISTFLFSPHKPQDSISSETI